MKKCQPFRRFAIILVVLSPVVGGCPRTDTTSGVTAQITATTTQGVVPLHVYVSAADSTSKNGAITGYSWDFGGLAASDSRDANYLFSSPGRYTVTLTVTDETGAQGVAVIDVRVAGTDADIPTAVITSDVDGGAAPLGVQFDGTTSIAPNDRIYDYYWDFNDTTTSRASKPYHVFANAGIYDVSLRVVTGGGLEASTTKRITVGALLASLEFTVNQQASLPAVAPASLQTLTLEFWFNATNGGGTAVTFGGLSVDVRPSAGLLRVVANSVAKEATVSGLVSGWHHVAVAYDDSGASTIYYDGAATATAAFVTPISPSAIALGPGYAGRIADVRLWSAVRTSSEIATAMKTRPSGGETNLLGYWPINEGAGQTLIDRTGLGGSGRLGTTSAADAADPIWSTDGPPLP